MIGATLFSGGEGVGLGMKQNGIHHAWGIEYDDKIASVARQNGFNVFTGDILKADPHCFEKVDILHASPPCPRFSIANKGRGETPHDIALSQKVGDFINTLKPRFFTLENVVAYVDSQSWQIIQSALWSSGYFVHCQNVNFADYGVPQSRRRMFVRAVRGGFVPYLPEKRVQRGWYQSVEDLLPGLPDSSFTNWQKARIPAEYQDCFLIGASGFDKTAVTAREKDPAFTITANANQTSIRAFWVDCQNNGQEWGKLHRTESEPSPTVTTGSSPKAFITNGRVVKMSIPCLARFQTFPDWYEGATVRIIGNAVPPIGYATLTKGLFYD